MFCNSEIRDENLQGQTVKHYFFDRRRPQAPALATANFSVAYNQTKTDLRNKKIVPAATYKKIADKVIAKQATN